MSSPLDDAVHTTIRAMRERDVLAPEVLYLMGTGVGTLPGSLDRHRTFALAKLPGVPPCWHAATLHTGLLQEARIWLLDDEADDGRADRSIAWERAFPVWLAAAAGAAVCLHSSAGVAIAKNLEPGALAILSDHVNLSGNTPLRGVGDSRLGPLFPDPQTLHHAGLRLVALDRARANGLTASETVAACTLGPTLSTPAEMRWLAQTEVGTVVQDLADPLLACAHAGLAVLAVVALTDRGEMPLRMAEVLACAETCAPALEELVTLLAPDLAAVARELGEEA